MLVNDLKNIGVDLTVILGTELLNLDRKATGNLINSLQPQVIPQGQFGAILKILGLSYWRVVEYGVPAQNVPYDASVRTGAGNSDYINGLINWIKVKGIASDNDTIRGIAFAIATKQTATSRGGYGLGNPINKAKLGFVRKSAPKVDVALQKVSKAYEKEIIKIMDNGLPNNITITI